VIAIDIVAEHAYELAFRACAGRRVAVLGGGQAARAAAEGRGAEVVEAGAFDAGGFDAAVLVRGRGEEGPAQDEMEAVRRLAGRGLPVAVSLRGDSDTQDAGDARGELESLLAGADTVSIIALREASGSLIAPADTAQDEVALSAEATEGLEPAAYLGLANVDATSLGADGAVRLAPPSGPPIAALERSVRALERANRSLARPAASRRGSAAASEIHRSTQLERRLLHLHRESTWVTLPLRIARGLARRLRALLVRIIR
jgi:hypothetical protein